MRRLAAVAVVVAVVLGAVPPAAAEGVDRAATDTSGVASFMVGFQDLGLGTSVTLAGITATDTITLPVPAGLQPAAIDGQINLSLDAPQATVDFSSGTDSLLRLNVTSATATPFVVPLSAVPVHDGTATVTVTSYVPFPDAFCRGHYRIPMVVLDHLSVGYAGSATVPTTIAAFFPPSLRSLRIWVPARPSMAQLQAALDLTSAIVALNPNRRMAVEAGRLPASGLPDPGPFSEDVRDVVIGLADAPSASVALGASGAPLLVLAGDGLRLALTESVVVSKLAGLLQSSRATVGGVFAPVVIPATEQTVSQLGAGLLEVSGEGRLKLDVPFSQAQFGGMVWGLTLHLRGTYTPVPPGSSADLSVRVNQQVVSDLTLSRSGHFDVQPVVPPAAIRRDNVLTVEVAYTPEQGVCAGGSVPFDLRLDPSSSVQARLGSSLPVGFSHLPQAFEPSFDLAVDQLDFPRASAALALVAAVSELSSEPLEARVVPPSTIVASTRPAMVLAAAGAVPRGLHPTVDLNAATGVAVIDQPGRDVQVGIVDAVAEVFENRGRTVVLVTWRSLGALTTLVKGLTAPDTGLVDVATDVVVSTSDGTITQVPVAATLTPSQPAPSSPGLPWWAVPTVLAVPVMIGAGLVRRRLRRARLRRPT